MNDNITSPLHELDGARADTLQLTAALTQPQADFTPQSGRWSVGEVLDHLVRSELLYRQKFLELIQLAGAGRPPVLRVSFAEVNTSIGFIPKPLLGMMEAPLGALNAVVPKCFRETFVKYRLIPAQAPSVAEPRRGRRIEDLRDDLRGAQRKLEALFAASPHLDFTRMRVLHPLLGDNNIPELLRFIATHERRHQKQIRDILRLAAFPAGAPAAAAAGK